MVLRRNKLPATACRIMAAWRSDDEAGGSPSQRRTGSRARADGASRRVRRHRAVHALLPVVATHLPRPRIGCAQGGTGWRGGWASASA